MQNFLTKEFDMFRLLSALQTKFFPSEGDQSSSKANEEHLPQVEQNRAAVYTWPASTTSSARAQGQMGHSALRTYNGGSDSDGVYVSFYPGDCNTQNRHPMCKKSKPHFHSWNHDDRNVAEKIDLDGLDVSAISTAFEKMHDGNMNSIKPWSPQYNCSDVVLKLLEIGGIDPYIGLRRYDFLNKSLLGGLIGNFAILFLNELYLKFSNEIISNYTRNCIATKTYNPNAGEIMKVFDHGLIVHTQILKMFDFSDRLLYLINIRKSILSYNIANGIMGSIFTSMFSYLFFLRISRKTELSYKTRSKFALIDSIKTALTSFAASMLISTTSTILSYLSYRKSYADPASTFSRYISISTKLFYGYLTPKFLLKITNDFKKLYMLELFGFVGLISVLSFPKYFYDTTTTPEYLNKIIENNKTQSHTQKEPSTKSAKQSLGSCCNRFFYKNQIINKIKEHKRYAVGSGMLIAMIGIMSFRNPEKLANFTRHITTLSMDKVVIPLDLYTEVPKLSKK